LADISDRVENVQRALETQKKDMEVEIRNYIIIILAIATVVLTAISIWKSSG
jgi:hypothetical protein